MPYVAEMDLSGVKICNRDFTGEKNMEKFGNDAKSFSIEISDPELQEILENYGCNLYGGFVNPNLDEPPKKYLRVNMDYRYGADSVEVVVFAPGKRGVRLNESQVGTLNKAWISNADVHIKLNSYKRGARSGVSAYCQSLFVTLMGDDERQELMEQHARSNATRDRYAGTYD